MNTGGASEPRADALGWYISPLQGRGNEGADQEICVQEKPGTHKRRPYKKLKGRAATRPYRKTVRCWIPVSTGMTICISLFGRNDSRKILNILKFCEFCFRQIKQTSLDCRSSSE
jgi:hypothetical protein